VTLALVNGRGERSEFVFDERSTCLIGRGEDCSPRLPNDEHHRSVSRHHCMLDINPPDVRIRDFGSRNGTYVNGVKIGQRDPAQSAAQGRGLGLQERDLKDGDEVRLGRSVSFRVSVKLPPEAATTVVLGAHLAETLPPPGCVKCGREITHELGIRGPAAASEFVCESCQANPEDVMTLLVKLAQAGTRSDLSAIAEYTLLGELGRGGMGAVYLARHKTTAQHVALKLMLPKVAANETARARFMREVELTRMLRHPNIAALYEDGFADGAFFFTTEYCEGGSLDKLLRTRGGKLPIDEAVKYALDVLDGLEYAHSRNVVHRDLSPSNILLAHPTTAPSAGPSNRTDINADPAIDAGTHHGAGTDNRAGTHGGAYAPAGNRAHADSPAYPSANGLRRYGATTPYIAKVGDFGLGKAFDQAGLSGLTRTGAKAGKPWYLARQQVVNFKQVPKAVDVWALAACLYKCLTGTYVRDFPDDVDQWHVILYSSPIPIRERDQNIPRALAEVIDEALREQPEIGFSTAAAFRDALRQAWPLT
jgi:eukaryotic-like serine/threonine-protein kinase